MLLVKCTPGCCCWLLGPSPWRLLLQAELDFALKEYVGRETPLYYAERLSQHYKR